MGAGHADTAEELLGRIGHLTRRLHEGLRELGLDKQVARAAEVIPDARERLGYVASMTEKAANRALNAIDVAQPIQDQLAAEAKGLDRRWNEWFDHPIDLDQARQLVLDTRGYLRDVPRQTGATNAQLLEIMMAQDFQDLTGQVIKKMVEVVNELETQLVQVLYDNAPAEIRDEFATATQNGTPQMHGPQINPQQPDAVTDQSQVDDLLESLGF